MNVVPTEFVRAMPEEMKGFVGELYRKVGMSDDRASLIADLQVQTDLRGVFSHGTRTAATYVRLMRDGKVNANPEVRTVQEGPATAVLDGDGGVGHFASWQAAHLAVDKAREIGLAAVATRNHHHFGPAGIYSRVPLAAGFVGYATSSHFRRLTADSNIMAASGASPLSWAIPAGDQPPIVLDMASGFGLRQGDDFKDMFGRVPAAFFKSLGLGAICHCLGGILAGICTVDEVGPQWPASNQGAMILAIDIGRFADPETYRRQMDEFLASVRGVRPFPGEERAMLPGWLEWERTEEWTKIGIPVSPDHAKLLGQVAEKLGEESPF